jgi:hypothetical protein
MGQTTQGGSFKTSFEALSRKLRDGAVAWLERDGLIMLLYVLATVAMTYPVAFRLGGKWLALYDGGDTYAHLWNVWWLERLVKTGQPLYFSRDLFYPLGLDLTYHSFSWTHAALTWLLSRAVSVIIAYNVMVLVAIFGTAYSAYLLIRPMVDHQWAALLGGAIYSFAPYHVAHSSAHPDLVLLMPVPLTALLFTRALTHSDVWAAVGAALMLGIAAFTSLYIMDFAAITVALLFFYLALDGQRWRQAPFWRTAIVFGVASIVFVGIRIVPLLRDLGAFSAALEGKYSADTLQTDLLAYAIPSYLNPLFETFVTDVALRFEMNRKWPAYLGLIPVVLTLSSLAWKKNRPRIWAWFGIGVAFVLLSLGPILRFNGQLYESVRLPAGYLAWLPPIRGVARPDYFVLGVLLALAVCAAHGLDRWMLALGKRKRAQSRLALALTALLLLEFWNGAYPGVDATLLVSPFYVQIAEEEGDFAIIELEMGRQPSKYYMYFQTVHERPIIEGLSSRTPADAYRYVDDNLVLNSWRYKTPFDCETMEVEEFQAGLDALAEDGFRYVIMHHDDNVSISETLVPYLMPVCRPTHPVRSLLVGGTGS